MNTPEIWRPHIYQKRAIKWLVGHIEAALFLDPGLGKTSITLAAFLERRKRDSAHRMLVVAPKRVCSEVWSHKGELGKWAQFNGLKVGFLHEDGGGKEATLNRTDVPDIFVINHDGLKWLCSQRKDKATGRTFLAPIHTLLSKGFDAVALDELSKFKNTKSKRFKLIEKFLRLFKVRWGLTGSPAANGLIDLFGQIKAIDGGVALGKYITNYRTSYFYNPDRMGWKWVIQPGADVKIHRAIAPLVLSMKAEDYLDLPELVERDVWVSLPESVRGNYTRMEKEFLAEVRTDTITAANAAAASQKLRQFASGGAYTIPIDDDGIAGERKVVHLHEEKTEALHEIVEELQGQPLIVPYEFDHDLERILRSFNKEIPVINGHTKSKDLSRILEEWNAGKIEVLAAHPKAVSHGLNMQGCNCAHIAWYTLTWNYEEYDQLIRRALRQGNKADRVIVYRILARKTVEEVVASVIRTKGRTQLALFRALQEYAKKAA
jgi:SNF2 family DNA or RNA helicase